MYYSIYVCIEILNTKFKMSKEQKRRNITDSRNKNENIIIDPTDIKKAIHDA